MRAIISLLTKLAVGEGIWLALSRIVYALFAVFLVMHFALMPWLGPNNWGPSLGLFLVAVALRHPKWILGVTPHHQVHHHKMYGDVALILGWVALVVDLVQTRDWLTMAAIGLMVALLVAIGRWLVHVFDPTD